MVMEK